MKSRVVRCEYCKFFISFYYDDRKVGSNGVKNKKGNFVFCWHFGYTATPPCYQDKECRFFMGKDFPSPKEWKKYTKAMLKRRTEHG